ncbi:unnamed protein product [Tetraodon nigroviridis]|uniref:(spotted green pufferfish) hypothetical protein n=1 Tax=Tetraodon nigroviridis TaxID=99883 RepID=Q4SXV2_TETNG|nr:unnamed protein product [Tetraodon nigroviridis]
MTEYTSQYADFSLPEHHQLHAWNQGQYLYQPGSGVYVLPVGCPAASSQSYSDDSAMMFPGVLEQRYSFRADLYEEDFPNFPSGSAPVFSAPHAHSPPTTPRTTCHHQDQSSRKRKQAERPQKQQVYIKKPLNAFMLFMKEQRPTVRPSIRCQGSGAVNAFLGKVWKSLSKKEQEKYYEAAEKERFLHQQKYPGWSNKENYGKMRTKAEKKKMLEVREEAEKESSEESFNDESEETPPSKWMMMTTKYRDKMKDCCSETYGIESGCHMTLRSRKPPNLHK